jgi:4-amino-4-deoxy-L-arabinose transferase-like glycosyltransferase
MKRLADPAVLWTFVIVAMFAWLGTRGLNEPDEGRYAEIAREMVASGDWLMPRLNGFEHLQKPPLLYWATAVSLRLFGVNEWAARLPSALAALGTLYLTWHIAAVLFGPWVRTAAVLILVSMAEFVLLSRTLTPDMMLTFWIALSIACLVELVAGRRGPLWRIGFFVAMGLGFLCKGPLALLVPSAAAVSWQIGLRRRGGEARLGWGTGLPISIAIGASWFVFVALQHPALVQYFLGYELRDRLFSSVHGRSQPFWFFLPVLFGGVMPWTPLLVAVGFEAWRAWRARESVAAESWLLGGWIVPPFVLLSLSGSKLATYVLPLFPPLALLMARWCATHADGPAFRRVVGGSVVCALVATSALPLVLAVLQSYDPLYRDVRFATEFALLLVVLTVFFAALLVSVVRRRVTTSAVLALGGGATVLWVGLLTQADRLLVTEGASVRPLARIIETMPAAATAEIFAFQVRGNGLEFYLRRLVRRTKKQSAIVLPPSKEQRRRVITSLESYPSGLGLRPALGLVSPKALKPGGQFAAWHVLGRSGRYALVANDAFLQAPGSDASAEVAP